MSMRRGLVGILAGLACAAALSAYAVTSGGFPSRPWLQALGIGIAAPPGTGNAQIAGGLGVGTAPGAAGTITANAALGVGIAAPSGGVTVLNVKGAGCSGLQPCAQVTSTTNAVFNATVTSTAANFAQITVKGLLGNSGGLCESDTANVCEASIPAGMLDVFGGNGIAIHTGSGKPVTVNGQPFTAYSIGASCVLTGQNVSGCTKNATGDYTVTFQTAYTRTPICVASSTQVTPGTIPVVAEISAVTTTQVETLTLETTVAATPYDGNIYVICN